MAPTLDVLVLLRLERGADLVGSRLVQIVKRQNNCPYSEDSSGVKESVVNFLAICYIWYSTITKSKSQSEYLTLSHFQSFKKSVKINHKLQIFAL